MERLPFKRICQEKARGVLVGTSEGGAVHSGLNLEGVTGLVNQGNGTYDLHFLIALVSAAGAWRRKLHQANHGANGKVG